MAFEAAPYRVSEALRLSRELNLSRPVSASLARRGFGDPLYAREFLDGQERHEPDEFDGMGTAVEQTLAAVSGGKKVTVYGDFDVDGVTATAIMVNALRGLGADCDWFIPDRISQGYGLSAESLRSIATRGTGFLVTVDCGVTAVEEVSLAGELGMGIVVTDHHRAGPELPHCTILHPEIGNYPFEQLCGAAVAAKFASALRSARGMSPELDLVDLDLVAMATVADVMPLTGENRRLVSEGLRVARRAERPGMRALMAACKVEPSRLKASDFGFRLGPRINAAGRMYRADAGVELFLAESFERATEISAELNRANSERRRVEGEVEAAARAARRGLDDSTPCSLVLAGEGWHSGVVGIVAAKMSREFGVPAVVISIDGDSARGSARSVPGLDLHGTIGDAADLLEGFGGHAAAAGLQIKPDRIPAFRAAFEAAVVARIGTEPATRATPVDAFAGGDEIGLDLAEQIERLEPFGKDNPSLCLLMPAARICDVREIGDGKHCRFTVVSGSARAAGVSFGRTGFGVGEDTPVDVLAELSVNHWNGSVEPQLRVIETIAVPEYSGEDLPSCEAEEWWARFEAAFTGGPGLFKDADPDVAEPPVTATFACPAGVAVAELASSGEPLLVVTADARRRWQALGGAAGLARFLPHESPGPSAIWAGSPSAGVEAFMRGLGDGISLCDYSAIVDPAEAPHAVANVLMFDPPAAEADLRRISGLGATLIGVEDPSSYAFAERASADRHDLTARLRSLYGGIREAGDARGEPLRAVLCGDPEWPHSPETAATLLRVLVETGTARTDGSGDARGAGILSSEKVDLESSPAFSDQARIHKEQIVFLRQSNR